MIYFLRVFDLVRQEKLIFSNNVAEAPNPGSEHYFDQKYRNTDFYQKHHGESFLSIVEVNCAKFETNRSNIKVRRPIQTKNRGLALLTPKNGAGSNPL